MIEKVIETDCVVVNLIDTTKRPTSQELALFTRGLLPAVKRWEESLFSKRKYGLGLKKSMIYQVELTIMFCGRTKIQSLNKSYRQKDKVTDVLSFPLQETLRPMDPKSNLFGPLIHLGDVVICKEVAREQSKRLGVTYIEELRHLFIHGLLHLVGFDHEISLKEEELMRDWETAWLQIFWPKR